MATLALAIRVASGPPNEGIEVPVGILSLQLVDVESGGGSLRSPLDHSGGAEGQLTATYSELIVIVRTAIDLYETGVPALLPDLAAVTVRSDELLESISIGVAMSGLIDGDIKACSLQPPIPIHGTPSY